MHPILAVTIPFFALVLAGYVAAQRGWLPESAIPGLNGFVLFFALPCMLLRFGAALPVAHLANPAVIGVWLLSALTIVALTIAATRRRVPMRDAAFGALVAAFPNTGFMGVPLLVALLGPAAAGPVMPTLLVDMFITSSLCIALAQSALDAGAPTETGARHALQRALRGALGNPLPWSILAGGLLSAAGLSLWGPLDTVVKMLADAASPVALFTIGAVVWRAGQHAHSRTPLGNFVPVALIKLLVHPLLVFALASAAYALELLDRFQLIVLTLAAALPSASSVSLLAERYRADNGRVARIIVASTALSFVTFSMLAWVFGVRGG
jgi:malonate transporter